MLSISEMNGINKLENSDKMILSVGISTNGRAEIEMAKRNKDCTIIATTLDEIGIKETAEILKKEGFAERINLRLEDISKKQNYGDETFDYIYARLVLHYLDNESLKNCLLELNRILKDNGKLYVVVRSINAWEAKLDGSSYDNITGLTKHPDLRTYGTPNVKYCYRRLHSPESIRYFLEMAGFSIQYIDVYDEILSIDYQRQNMNEKPSELIEVYSKKILKK